MTSKVVSIHQPNFFPWLGYFEKIVRSDYFIFLDNVQFPKKGGSWTNRVKLIVSGQPKWLTANINRQYHGTLLINEMTFAQGNPWRAKIIKSLQTSYSKHPFFDQTMDILDPLIMNSETNISEYNICAVTSLASAIGIDCDKFTRASAFPISDISTARLCVLANSVAADTYLSGGGSSGYQEDQLFSSYNLGLKYQNFKHSGVPPIRYGFFAPGLSIIDAAMNVGFTTVSELLGVHNLD